MTDDQEAEFRGSERFEVLARLGAGGMGEVYEVFDRRRRARVALKRLRRLGPEALARFKREFRALEALEHPNLVLSGELIEEAGEWFFTMELVPGEEFLTYVRPGDPAFAPGGPGAGASAAGSFSSARTIDSGATARLDDPAAGARAHLARVAAPPPDGALADAGFDEARLRACLTQLGSAVAALHAAGKVHRDIKPQNLRVAPDGRLALLDLGLVLDVRGDTQPEHAILGTADYMAPEQAAGADVGPAADWYAVGVLLYQALTGQLPFSGPPLEVMAIKRETEPPAPGAIATGVPADLDRLCMALLAIDPARRPGDEAVLAALAGHAGRPARVTQSPPPVPFVGREAELFVLGEALAALSESGAVTLLIEGESGIGKSALAARFVEKLTFAPPDPAGPPPLVLPGRCHEREEVRYKAFDDVVDALSRALQRLSPRELAALLPAEIGLLAQVFPALARLPQAVRAGAAFAAPRETSEKRDLLFRALRTLLARLGARGPLVLVIDDLQWADADSLALLRFLLAPPEPPRLLLLCTVRTSADAADELVTGLDLPGEVRRLSLGGLAEDDARTLAGLLAGGAHAARIAGEAAGHPLFMSELTRYAEQHPDAPLDAVRLEQALWSRIIRLDPRVRRLLELVAVAGAPLRQDAAARAAEADDATTLARWVAALRAAHLVKTSGPDGSDTIEPYHDRVREAVRLHLADEARAVCHRRIAVALEGLGGADAETLATHWQGAGDHRLSAAYAAAAAEEAMAALAFDRAARLLRSAVELGAPEPEQRAQLLARCGEALIAAGRAREAAEVNLEAAALAPPQLALELRRRAAEQYLRSGHLEEGHAALAPVLRDIRMRLASTPPRALASLLFTRARVWLRGHRFTERREEEVPQAQLTRIDTCWSIAAGLAMVDTIRGAEFQARHLLLALEAGEPFRVCRALAAEAAFRSTSGGMPAARGMLDEAEALAARTGDARARAFVLLARGMAGYLDGQWRGCLPDLEAAVAHMRDHTTGLGWELYTARFYALLAHLWSGELAEACRRINLLRMDAVARGDRYASATLSNSMCSLSSLVLDDPEGGLEMARRVVEDLPAFQFQHYWEMGAGVFCNLYRGDGAAAMAMVEERWAPSRRSMFFRIDYIRIEALALRGFSAVAAARAARGAARERLCAIAAKDAASLLRERPAYAAALGHAVAGGRALVAGEREEAVTSLERAVAGYAASDMKLYRAATEHLLGRLAGGEGGERRRAEAERWLRGQGVKNPARMALVFAPAPPDV